MFQLVDQKRQHLKTSLQSFRQQPNLTHNFFPRPAVPNPLANANLKAPKLKTSELPKCPNTHLSKLFLPIPSCVVILLHRDRAKHG